DFHVTGVQTCALPICGSYLGAKAVIDALVSPFETKGPEILFAGHHMGDAYHRQLMNYLSAPKADGSSKSVYVNVISKSGTTLERSEERRVGKNYKLKI